MMLAYRFKPLVQPVIVHGYAHFVVLLQEGFGFVQCDHRLAGAFLQPVHHDLELERIDVQLLALRGHPHLIRAVHIVIRYVLLESDRCKNERNEEND